MLCGDMEVRAHKAIIEIIPVNIEKLLIPQSTNDRIY